MTPEEARLAKEELAAKKKEYYEGLEKMKREEDLKRLSPPEQNTILRPVKNFTKSMATWVGGGFKRVQQHVYEKRMTICRGCQFWEEKGNLGMGKCLKCGCGRGKHWLPHEQCPIGLWGKENT